MSDELLTTAQKQLESIEATLQRTRMLQTEGHKNLQELASTQGSASTEAVPERHRRFPSIADTKPDRQCSKRGQALLAAWQTMRSSLGGPSQVPDTYTEYKSPVYMTFPAASTSYPSSRGSQESVTTVVHAPDSTPREIAPIRPGSECSKQTSDPASEPDQSIYITGSVMRRDSPPEHSGPAPPSGTEAIELIYFSEKGYNQTWIAWKDSNGEFVETRFPDFAPVSQSA